jgi:putative FmdB family regulatory protein
MPIYDWECQDCKASFEVIRSYQEYNLPAICNACQSSNTIRLISQTSFYGAGGWDSVSYNPGLGCITKNTKHAEQIARQRNLIPIGSEDLERTIASQEAKEAAKIEEITKPAYDALEHGIKTEYLAKR